MTGGLIELDAARRAALERAQALGAAGTAIGEALGRVLAEDLIAPEDVPAFASSAMDGFAVRGEDTAGVGEGAVGKLALVGESRAGRPCARTLGRGEAIAISTGAVMPAGADAVVRVEDTRLEDGQVLVMASAREGANVRFAGEDIAAGETVLAAGTRLGPAELGVIASLGRATVACTRVPAVAVLTTGDELVDPGAPTGTGAVRNSSAQSIPALVRRSGGEVCQLAHVGDDPDETSRAIERALASDMVVICGGVSVGAHDHVAAALAGVGVEQVFAGLALRPGKPARFGARGRTLVFALPGNPVSAMVCFVLLAGPALRRLGGEARLPGRLHARLGSDYEKPAGRAHAVRCRLEQEAGAELVVHPTGPQGSHILTSMLHADCLAIIPSASAHLRAGELVEVEPLAPWVG